MEELPVRARTVMTVYSVGSLAAPAAFVIFEAYKREILIIGFLLVTVILVSAYFYVRLYFRHYRYHISDSVIVVKKGAAFKRRCLIYTEKIGSMTVSENFILRRFGLCTVWLRASGGTVKLSFLQKDRSDRLYEILENRD